MLTDIDVSRFETLFLDRDGVINRWRDGDYVKRWEEFEFLPGILDALAKWSGCFKHIIIATNQRGVGKGLMSEDDLQSIHRNMLREIENAGGRIDRIYCCTALSDDDPDRKPNIGMALRAKRDFPDMDFGKSLMIGDSDGDMLFASRAGMTGIKITQTQQYKHECKHNEQGQNIGR
jgi:histidinol-phosphate phosphatase family protein